ncbi:MAG: helix-turn-helix transcriptional regulator [Treponema sp.]|nr:helix-turn-helix transcriptional regulator [Treponema sp.]MBR4629904.1 helix-turn-helix transcriptional regulator [Treponema sp.]MCR5124221.1 helix-turn-helix domain-containing protein [Treponema sp.]
MGFRENLKEELTYQDIKVKELAEMTGISKHTLDHYLATNGSQPQAELAVKIAHALHTSVESLVCGKNSESSSEKIPTETDMNMVINELRQLHENDFMFVKKLVHMLKTG